MQRGFTVPTFYPEGHRYTVDGIVRPSVTTILAEAGLAGSPFYTEEARDRGSLVHALTANRDGQRSEVVATDEELSAVTGYLLAYGDFCELYRPEWEYVEQPIFDPELNVAGTLDRAGVIPGIGEILLDLKTGLADDWHRIQTAAYNRVIRCAHRGAIYLRPNGTFKLHRYTQNAIDEARWIRAVRSLAA